MLFCPLSVSCKRWVVPWWLKFGKFGSGREKAAQGSGQSGGKTKNKTKQKKENRRPSESEPDSLECSQTLEWTVPLPLPLLSAPLCFFILQIFSPLFYPNPSISKSACCSLTSLPILISVPPSSPPTAHVSQYLPIIPQCSESISLSWIISDLYRGKVSFPLSLFVWTHSLSLQRKSWKPSECKVNVFNCLHPSKCILKTQSMSMAG